MKTIKMSHFHSYILNEGIEEIQSKTEHFQTLLSVLPNGDKLQKDFSSVVTNLLQPGTDNRNTTIEFIKSMTTSIEQFLSNNGLSLRGSTRYPLRLLEVGVVGLSTIIMKLFEVLMVCIKMVENKTTTTKEDITN